MKLIGFLLQNLAVLALILALFLLYGWWRSDPQIVDRELPVHYQEEPARGVQGEPVRSRGVTVLVSSIERRPSQEIAVGTNLSSRARVDGLTDLVLVGLQVHNESQEPVSFDYYGMGQRADILLGTRSSTPTTWLPLLPHDLQKLGVSEPFPPRVLEPGEKVSGILGFTVNRQAREPALALLPAYHLTPDGASLPSFEIDLQDVEAR